MTNRVPCNICSTEILVTTAERTNGRCMPCSYAPERIAKNQAHENSLKDQKRLVRELDSPPESDPYTRLQEFESLIFCDGFDQAYPDEVVGVLDALKQVTAPDCVAILNEFLDFIEAGCSTSGHYDPSIVDAFLVDNMEGRLEDFWKLYTKASELENPLKQLKNLLAKECAEILPATAEANNSLSVPAHFSKLEGDKMMELANELDSSVESLSVPVTIRSYGAGLILPQPVVKALKLSESGKDVIIDDRGVEQEVSIVGPVRVTVGNRTGVLPAKVFNESCSILKIAIAGFDHLSKG